MPVPIFSLLVFPCRYSAHILVLVAVCFLIMVFADINNVHK